MLVETRYQGELFPILARKEQTVTVLKDGERQEIPFTGVEVKPAKTFGAGMVRIENVIVDYHPTKIAGSRPNQGRDVQFRYEADVKVDNALDESFALITFVTSGSVGTYLFPVGNLAAGQTRHIKAELESRVDSVGNLHVFSNAQEIRSNIVQSQYDVHAYLESLRLNSRGISAWDLCKSGQPFAHVLSDDGGMLATVRDRETHYSILVVNLKTMKLACEASAGAFGAMPVDLRWVSDREVVFRCDGKLHLLDVSTKSSSTLLDDVISIAGSAKGHPEMIVVHRAHDGTWSDMYDVHSHKSTYLGADNQSGFAMFNAYGEQWLRLVAHGGNFDYEFRTSTDGSWSALDSSVKESGLTFDIKGGTMLDRVAEIQKVGPDGVTLYISSRLGSDRFELASYGLKEGRILSVFAKSEKYDLANSDDGVAHLLFSKASSKVVGLVYSAEKPTVIWFDEKLASIQTAFDKVFPDNVNIPVDWTDDGHTFVYFSYSDHDPGAYYIFEPLAGVLIPSLSLGDRLKGRTLARTAPFDFEARDGATVHGYVTYPPDGTVGKAPLIVSIHGGPADRDNWVFDPKNQFLATRGYAVLQVNFRGSSGYGATYQAAGLKSRIDTVVIDDIADGVKNLIKEGKVDSTRIGVMGASFGGWATYLSLIKYPQLYRAGVAISAISHWRNLEDARYDRWGSLDYSYLKALLRGKNFGSEEKFIDPLLMAGEIAQPIYIMHGTYDDTVPMEQATMMVDALEKKGARVKHMWFSGSSHTVWRLQDKVTLLNEVGAFFDENLAAAKNPGS